ncbi:carbon-monoxide dehydrogenase medium subunit [Sphaerisporangium krabiense]|uniref:Carbon-monoxide dehydrogenase medium subunit n=1 Tax=Sphaerisporangium krabiense TaxID=763782 RepID=A0A7W8YZU0_9ACTN|nr:xanthine dehydrogenase family protein subunit M [Sphaerisporangium krabiense]MBB5624854.1 carbon-monoxide dehydrogenase medium subunit [Sphaerisporangium krabiense]GII66445.1 carbon-monoxide dehydrogenase medium subunit [Sphaerisporangium krabiense]
MIPAAFDYVRPSSLEEAVEVLEDAGDEGKVLSGGQSLLPLLRLRLAYPSVLVDIGRLPGLRGIRDEGGHVHIGATTTHDEIVRSPLVNAACPLVALATATVADPAVRHRGTFGGSLAHADPAGDLPAVALALDMEFVIRSGSGERVVAARDFFTDYLETALEPGEILTGVRVPKPGEGWGFHYEKFHRTAQAWAIVGVAAAVRVSGDATAPRVEEARVALTNMGPTPIRATTTESAARGATLTTVPALNGFTPATAPGRSRAPGSANGLRDALREAASHADEGTSPTADLHATPEYRRHLARVLTYRALRSAATAARRLPPS